MKLQAISMSTEPIDESPVTLPLSSSFLEEKIKITVELDITGTPQDATRIAPSVGGLISLLMSVETGRMNAPVQFPDTFPAPVAAALFDAMRELDEDDWSEIRRAEAASGAMFQFDRGARPGRLQAIVSVALAAVIRKAARR